MWPLPIFRALFWTNHCSCNLHDASAWRFIGLPSENLDNVDVGSNIFWALWPLSGEIIYKFSLVSMSVVYGQLQRTVTEKDLLIFWACRRRYAVETRAFFKFRAETFLRSEVKNVLYSRWLRRTLVAHETNSTLR